MTKETYNGWANYATWNIALWIGNDEGLYHFAKDYGKQGYTALAEALRECGTIETPDHVSYSDRSLDTDELDDLLKEL